MKLDMGRDVSGKNNSESKSPEVADRRLQLLIDSVRDYAIFMLDPTGKIESWNLGAELIKGYLPQEIIGQHIERFYTPEDVAAGRPRRLLGEARERGRVEDEGWRVRKDGTRFWADVVITAVRDQEGEMIGFLKVTRDLTERRHADQLRLAHEHRFRILVERAREYAIFMLDPKGFIATWNEGAERIKGYRAEEIIGQHFSRFYPPGDVASGRCEMELDEALRNGRFEDEGWRLRKDGAQFWASVVIAPLYDQNGTHIGFSKITRDMTERVRSEQERIALAHAQEALRLRDEFFSIAAHELRTPLVALQLQIDSLRMQTPETEHKQISKLDRAGRNVQRLSELISSLLDVARISKGELTLNRKRVDLGTVVAEVVDRLQETAAAARCKLITSVVQGIVGDWDPLRIGQVVANLLANAFKYAKGSPVDVSLVRDGDEAVLRVEDRGPGIAPAYLEAVFNRFERAGTRDATGMGLGLYVAREIATAHGGTVFAASREGGGTTIEMRLPVRTQHETVKGEP
jgi:PAS domain S-box-containing protein